MQESGYSKIKTELGDGHLKNLYLLYGNEEYLKKAILKKMTSLADKYAGENLERISFEKGFSAEDLTQALNTVSFFGNGKFVTCTDTEIFKGQGKNVEFEKALGKIPSECYVVFVESSTDKKNELFIEINKAGFAYSIDMRSQGDLAKYIAGRFKSYKKKIAYENINLFIEYSGSSLTDIEADIEKILLYMDNEAVVKKEYIENLCSGTRQYRIYEMTDKIFSRDTKGSLQLLNDLLADKIPVQVMLAAIHNRLRELADLRELIDKGRDPVIFRKGRQVADFIIRRLQKQAANYTLNNLRSSIIMAADLDIDIKEGKIGDVMGIEILVNTLSTV